jgi:hypothetical protein
VNRRPKIVRSIQAQEYNTDIPDQYILEELSELLNAAEIASKQQNVQHDSDQRQPA